MSPSGVLFVLHCFLCELAFCQRMVNIQGGLFEMGIMDRNGVNGEAPPYPTGVKPFKFDVTPVTNKHWMEFIEAKPNFRTDAETRRWSWVYAGYLSNITIEMHGKENETNERYPDYMVAMYGATWRSPLGPGSKIIAKLDHPVVHISKRDASAYCLWRGKRLPSEYEWEFAARAPTKAQVREGRGSSGEFPWGEFYQTGRCNLWQRSTVGTLIDSGNDGYNGTSPVTAYPPQNKLGLYDLIGNVWEWTNTQWHIRGTTLPASYRHHFVLKGGSHLDTRKGHFGERVRIANRIPQMVYYSASNVGFRCAKDLPKNPEVLRRTVVFHSEL